MKFYLLSVTLFVLSLTSFAKAPLNYNCTVYVTDSEEIIVDQELTLNTGTFVKEFVHENNKYDLTVWVANRASAQADTSTKLLDSEFTLKAVVGPKGLNEELTKNMVSLATDITRGFNIYSHAVSGNLGVRCHSNQ